MSSALKPVLTPAGAQNPAVPSQLNKPMHPQGPPTTYGQPMSHIPQNLVNIPHNAPSSTNVHNPAHSNAHSVPHHITTNAHGTAHSANHYSLSVPNAPSQHYPVSGNTPVSSHSAPVSNHPVANPSQSHTQPATTFSNPPKNLTYNPNYQANRGHSYKPTNVTSPQNPSVPQVQPQAVAAAPEESTSEKPQSNGTPDIKTPSKPEPPQNHISTPAIKDKPPPPPPPAPPQVQVLPPAPEKPKITLEKPAPIVITVSTTEQKPNADVNKSEVTNASVAPDKTTTSTGPANSPNATNSSNNAITTSPVHSVNVPSPAATTPSTVAATTTSGNTNITTPIITTTSTPSVQPTQPTVTTSLPEPPESQDSIVTTTTTTTATITATINNKPKEQINQKSTLKLATTPRTPLRKAKTPKPETPDSSKSSKSETKLSTQKSPSSGGKTKRTRTKTQPYQSPLPEVEMVSKISVTTPRNKNIEDKLIIFYKNEFLAVRNSEGGFYICQAVQNIYKSSPRIRIRWLSQDKNDKEVYSPDFYDYTDFDCILTNLNLGRVDKGKYKLPGSERIRTDSILKRAIAVEKGDATPPSLTEEHPDGLDLSLYKEESQLKKRKSGKRKASSPLRAASVSTSSKKSPDLSKVRKVSSKPKSPPVKKSTVLKRALSAKVKKVVEDGRAERAAKRRIQEPPKLPVKTSPVIDHKKAKVLAKVARKAPAVPPPKPQPLPKQNTKIVKQVSAASSSKKPPPAVVKKEKLIVTRKSKRGKK